MAPCSIILNRIATILKEYPCIVDAPASPADSPSMHHPPHYVLRFYIPTATLFLVPSTLEVLVSDVLPLLL